MIKSKNANNTVTAKMYDTLVRPVITENGQIVQRLFVYFKAHPI